MLWQASHSTGLAFGGLAEKAMANLAFAAATRAIALQVQQVSASWGMAILQALATARFAVTLYSQLGDRSAAQEAFELEVDRTS